MSLMNHGCKKRAGESPNFHFLFVETIFFFFYIFRFVHIANLIKKMMVFILLLPYINLIIYSLLGIKIGECLSYIFFLCFIVILYILDKMLFSTYYTIFYLHTNTLKIITTYFILFLPKRL